MFSGIVEAIGRLIHITHHLNGQDMTISLPIEFNDIKIGDSLSINGVCLTVTEMIEKTVCVTAVLETLRVTNLNQLCVNDSVNLERALTLQSRIGGHYVQGHVDGTGKLIEIMSDHRLIKISVPESLTKYIVPKGYITLDGMSITVIEAGPAWFTVTLIPHTQAVTIASDYKVGTVINIEVDILGKYVENILRGIPC